jgi:AcrR family transcriptional regulator
MTAKTMRPMEAEAPKTRRGERTRAKILRAAEEVFGRLGFHGAGITDITRRAGIAQGTFYVHFRSKEENFRELVRQLGRELRRFLSERVAGSSSRLEAEERGLRAYLEYISEHKNLYRILQEALVVDLVAYQEYFEDFGRAYERLLNEAEARGELSPGNNQVRAWALMGMAQFLGMRYALWNRDVDFDTVVGSAADLVRSGLAARPATG